MAKKPKREFQVNSKFSLNFGQRLRDAADRWNMDGKVGRLVTYIIEKDHPLARRGLKIRDELIEKNNILIEKQNKIIEEQKKLLKNSYDDGVVRGIIWAVAQPKEAVLLVERWRVIHGQRAATG